MRVLSISGKKRSTKRKSSKLRRRKGRYSGGMEQGQEENEQDFMQRNQEVETGEFVDGKEVMMVAKPNSLSNAMFKVFKTDYMNESKAYILDMTSGNLVNNPNFKADKGGIKNGGFMCKNVNIGSCDENDSLIILFEDDTKITLTAWNKFNCEGNAYFDFSESQLTELSTKKVNTIRFSNGRSYESLTVTLKEDQKDYFVRAYSNQKIIEVDCSK